MLRDLQFLLVAVWAACRVAAKLLGTGGEVVDGADLCRRVSEIEGRIIAGGNVAEEDAYLEWVAT